MVVSAPGDMTDDLIEMSRRITDTPDEREMDMLLSTGEQVSIALLVDGDKSSGRGCDIAYGPAGGNFRGPLRTQRRALPE